LTPWPSSQMAFVDAVATLSSSTNASDQSMGSALRDTPGAQAVEYDPLLGVD